MIARIIVTLILFSFLFDTVHSGPWNLNPFAKSETAITIPNNTTTPETSPTEANTTSEYSGSTQSNKEPGTIDDKIDTNINITTNSDGLIQNTVPHTNTKHNSIRSPLSEPDVNGCPTHNLFPELTHFFNNSFLSDFELVLGQDVLKVHQFVLSAKSEVFAHEFAKAYIQQFNVNEDKYSFIEFIRFFYTESFPMDKNTDLEFIKNVYEMARKHKVPRLIHLIEKNLNKTFAVEKISKIIEFSRNQNLGKALETSWRDFIKLNSDEIFQRQLYLTDDWYTMECIIISLDMNADKQITALKNIKNLNRSDIDLKRYQRFIKLEECGAKELFELDQMDLIDKNVLLESVAKQFDRMKDLATNYDRLVREKRNLDHQLQKKCEINGKRSEVTPRQPINFIPNYNHLYKRKPININELYG